MVPIYDIFAGRYGDTDARWIQAVEGLGAAADQMRRIAKIKRGPYFVFDAHAHKVLASVDTTAPVQRAAKKSA
jgi:hypothetical protein